ncbi:RNA polymerase sigma-70 factor [Pedobacter sp. PAMC26386]|nr:RNA polymerase sigma-70 factor [Pedobacter sp. PAMC26386]
MSSYSKTSDSELYHLLKTGDRNAYTEIYQRYKGLLFIFAYKKTANAEEAQDLIHELFFMLWEKRAELHVSSELSAYLFFVLKNKIFDLFRHKKVSDRYLEHFSNYLIADQKDTDHLIRHHDLSELIESEIAALPVKMRKVFELSRKTNLNRKQIASELDLSEQTVKSHIHRALAILKTRLA